MTEKEKELKSFNQCADALSNLDNRGIMKVFQMLSIHFEIITATSDNITNVSEEVKFIEDKSKVNTPKIDFSQSNVKTNRTKKNSSKDFNYLTDFDYAPSNKTSLREFYEKYKITSNYENNLVFVYYLQEIIKIENISIDHIYSFYRFLGLSIPSFPQTLVDTKKNKGWIETKNTNDIKLTRVGLNHIEQTMINGKS